MKFIREKDRLFVEKDGKLDWAANFKGRTLTHVNSKYELDVKNYLERNGKAE